jgi:hypothetical protein
MKSNKKKSTSQPSTAMVSKSTKGPPVPPMIRKDDKRAERDTVKMLLSKLASHGEADVPLDPAVVAWAEQLDDLFYRESEPVHCPLFQNSFGCPTTVILNYASADLAGYAEHTLLPIIQGAYSSANDGYTAGHVTYSSIDYPLGPIISMTGTAASPIAMLTSNGLNHMGTGAASALNPLFYDGLLTPFGCGGSASSNNKYRTIAYNVRITFQGPLSETEGYIRYWQPYEPITGSAASGIHPTVYDRDRSYRKKFFSARRTYEVIWHPSCDDLDFIEDTSFSNVVHSVSSRMPIWIGGLKSSDTINVEVIAVQEWTGIKSIPTQVPRLATPDTVHVQNAIVLGHGLANASDGKAKYNLAHVAKAAKIATHGWIKTARSVGEGLGSALAVYREGKAAFSTIAKVLGG